MYELKKIGKVFTSKFVGTGPSSYEKGFFRFAVSQRLRNTALWFINWIYIYRVISDDWIHWKFYYSVTRYDMNMRWGYIKDLLFVPTSFAQPWGNGGKHCGSGVNHQRWYAAKGLGRIRL